MKTAYTLALMATSTLLLTACTETRPAPGEYQTTTERTDANGTVHKTDSTTNIYYDKNGNMKGSVDKKSTTDPKGLMNKSTTESHKTIQ